jgi:phage terminase large subunit-like protein
MDAKQKRDELRFRAQTDLFFLGRNVLGYDFVERVHRPVCDFFVHKDPRRDLAEQDAVKERMLLDPRGHFKTTIDACDIIQWIICFPDIRINIMSGKQDNAEAMLREVGDAFVVNEKLRTLFPEHAVPEGKVKDWLTTTEFITPARKRTRLKEPTISISSLDSVKASKHYDIIKCDDLVHEGNVGTREQIQKTITGFNYTTQLLEPFGYRDRIGTRYDNSDLYGWTIEQVGEEQVEAGKIKIPFGWVYLDNAMRIFCRRAWENAEDNQKVLLFPERFTVEWLEAQRKADEYIFNCQYLNDPTPTDAKTFTEELILKRTIPFAHIPRSGRLFQTWDLGFSNNAWSDYSVCATGLFDPMGRLFIIDLDVGRYSPYELAMHVILNYLKWRPARVGIEKAAGSPLLEPSLMLLGQQYRIVLPLDWIPVKNGKGIKEEHIGALHPLLETEKLFFSAALPHFEDLKKQFKFFPRYKHDDIPDAISMLLNYRTVVDVVSYETDVEMGGVAVSPHCYDIGAGLVG